MKGIQPVGVGVRGEGVIWNFIMYYHGKEFCRILVRK